MGPYSVPPIESLLLLGGSVRRSPFADATERSILDLPLDRDVTILRHWQHCTRALAQFLDRRALKLRLLLDRSAPRPLLPAPVPEVEIVVEQDPRPYRGTGGVLRDALESYPDDSFVLVGNAAQVLLHPLSELVWAMAATGGDICVVSHLDGTPGGLMLLKAACLRHVPAVGFVDLKEQAMPQMSQKHRASVIYREFPSGLPVRSLENYIRALRCFHRSRVFGPAADDQFQEDWGSSFSIVEEGAEVDADVCLHDSVVLKGGRVEHEAFVARSIVCPGGKVYRRRTVVGAVVK